MHTQAATSALVPPRQGHSRENSVQAWHKQPNAERPWTISVWCDATGEDWETQSSSEEEQGSESESDEADSGAEDGQGEPSVIADTIGSLEEPMTQVTSACHA